MPENLAFSDKINIYTVQSIGLWIFKLKIVYISPSLSDLLHMTYFFLQNLKRNVTIEFTYKIETDLQT